MRRPERRAWIANAQLTANLISSQSPIDVVSLYVVDTMSPVIREVGPLAGTILVTPIRSCILSIGTISLAVLSVVGDVVASAGPIVLTIGTVTLPVGAIVADLSLPRLRLIGPRRSASEKVGGRITARGRTLPGASSRARWARRSRGNIEEVLQLSL